VTQKNPSQRNETGGLVSFDLWLKQLGKTRITGWRWRRDGIISTLNVFGKIYIQRSEIERFESRALAGEFKRAFGVAARPANLNRSFPVTA
jgi:hypothetical protein